MQLNKNLFFTLFPIGYWVAMVVGIAFHFLPGAVDLGNVLISWATFLLAYKVAIMIHETGHLLAAKAAGGTPRRMVLGKGHELFRTEIFNLKVIVNSTFLGGRAYATFGQQRYLKLRYATFILGGILSNVVLAVLMSVFFEIELLDHKGDVIIAVPNAIFLANAAMVLNLIPYYTTILGMKVPTDGLALLKLPFMKSGEIKRRLDMNILWQGFECLEKRDYESAWGIFTQYLEKYPDARILSMYLSLILLKTGKPEESLKECLKLLDHLNDRQIKRYTGLIYNQIAWTCLVLNDIGQADHFSTLAIKAVPNENNIRGTRGSVLVEAGSISEGIKLLFHNMDFRLVNNATLSSAIYLMLAYHINGNKAESSKYCNFVKAHLDKLEADELVLWKRNLDKMQLKELVQ